MRLDLIVLVLATCFLAPVESTSKATKQAYSAVIDAHAIRPARSLLAEADVVKADEERAGVGNAVEALAAGTSKLIDVAKLEKYLNKKKTAVYVLNKLQFGDDVAGALKNTNLEALNTYIAMLNNKNSDEVITLIGTLSARYGDDAVAKALVTAERNAEKAPELAALAKQLRSQQVFAWLDNGKSVDDVFNLLKLRGNDYEALTSRKLDVLEDYITKFNRENPEHKTNLVKTLTKGFGGETNLVGVLQRAKGDIRTRTKAFQLEEGLIRQWVREKLEPARVMALLNLDNDVNGVLNSSNLKIFQKYLQEFNTDNLNSPVTLLTALTSKYDEGDVAKAIISALRHENTPLEKLAVRLQNELLDGWMKRDMSVDDVFKLLKFNNDVSVVVSRNLETLKEYIRLYNRVKSQDETLAGVLARGFGGESNLAQILVGARSFPQLNAQAKKLQRAQFKEWNERMNVSPRRVLPKIFDVTETSATELQKRVVRDFKTYVKDQNAAANRIVEPRRLRT
ncbi:hypothetical protein AM587_10005568 [Phytophthora nicotianae]|uniref:Uncharacterized protein n=2 Tax=Phytophthora nicotianae TaxID=4792 RepID=A0A0W8CN68_PHYNI|nr:hypothetical protein AM587_10005142 [Phytophthora nicotianae]KUF85413.1 hypothetical protein AM587_10005568 [Phytophthora nicotianae]